MCRNHTAAGASRARIHRRGMALLWFGLWLGISFPAAGVDLETAQRQFLAGNYTGCVALAEETLREQPYSEEWRLLLAQGLLAMGRVAEARGAVTDKLAQESPSIRLRWLAREAYLSNGQTIQAAAMLEEITQFVKARSWSYRDPPNLVTFGRVALLKGVDPKTVLDKLFQPAKESDPNLRDVYLAIGGLALDKHDFALAAKGFQEGNISALIVFDGDTRTQ